MTDHTTHSYDQILIDYLKEPVNPEDVPDSLVDKAVEAFLETPGDSPEPEREKEWAGYMLRHSLAAVLPEIQAQALAPLLAVHERYFNTEVDAFNAAEDFAPEDAWRFDRDFREAVRQAITSEDRKAADEWCQQLAVKVIDPDGWRTSDGTSWDTPITETEFHERAARSTIAAIVTDTDEVRERFARSMGIPVEAITPTPGSNPHDVAIAQGKQMMADIEEPMT